MELAVSFGEDGRVRVLDADQYAKTKELQEQTAAFSSSESPPPPPRLRGCVRPGTAGEAANPAHPPPHTHAHTHTRAQDTHTPHTPRAALPLCVRVREFPPPFRAGSGATAPRGRAMSPPSPPRPPPTHQPPHNTRKPTPARLTCSPHPQPLATPHTLQNWTNSTAPSPRWSTLWTPRRSASSAPN